MHPLEIWWLIEAKRPAKKFGQLAEHEVADLLEDLEEAGYKVKGADG